ncbi:hypothetical protein PPL_06268 [Heterostelium album PN500]|uniref:Uncharacterized protein n=1 Tax=Heterostelium pallidum (strain ATCC 26659 / Pp 5 / PN500) TaxID=670386 RepID=D3BCP2_HETP5|nr:hypothetical protein PPL_06268 [Heterostelium album PN500]EFA80684.1 hypothetical protein PPL_06268 [Heterostelium album PN500]|eukprot:XP_020432804.1 hypothetical protein PPL_06268 [Heterostelium album PN500]
MKKFIFIFIFFGLAGTVLSLPSYFTFKPSTYYCPYESPSCPKYLLDEVNSKTNINIELRDFDFEPQVNKSIVLSGGRNNVVVKGFFMTVQGPVRFFRVQEAYRLVPLDNPPPKDVKFYQVRSSGQSAFVVNENSSSAISSYDTSVYNSIFLLDKDWLDYKIKSEQAIVSGSISDGKLVVAAVYVNIKDPATQCPSLPLFKCQEGYVVTYTRQPDRCYDADGCTKTGGCPLVVPQCSKNYRRVSIPSKPHGCYKYKCEPDFLPLTSYSRS